MQKSAAIKKLGLAASLLLLLAISCGVARHWYWCSHPDTAFRALTGRELPAGVNASAYGREMTDNLFHVTHFWLLTGSPSALRQVTNGTGFAESEDAPHMLPDIGRVFGVSSVETQVIAGYEWELPRNRWYCIFAGGTNALYSH